MAKKNGSPAALLGYMQRDAIGSYVVLLERKAVGAAGPLRSSSSTQQQACGPARQENTARNGWHGSHTLIPPRCDGRHVLAEALRL